MLRYWGVVGQGGEGWGVVEALSVWGYSMFVWIPVSVSYWDVSRSIY